MRLKARIEKTTAQLTAMPRGGGADRCTQLVGYIENDSEYTEARLAYLNITKAYVKTLDFIPLASEKRNVIIKRFLAGKTWKTIGSELGKTERTAYNLFNSACEDCASFLNQNGIPNFLKEYFT